MATVTVPDELIERARKKRQEMDGLELRNKGYSTAFYRAVEELDQISHELLELALKG